MLLVYCQDGFVKVRQHGIELFIPRLLADRVLAQFNCPLKRLVY